MSDYRIKKHPILDIEEKEEISFYWKGQEYKAQKDEMITSALFANGIRVFSYHQKDEAPLGIFCANGQCSQCMVVVNGTPVRGCMTPIEEGMRIEPLKGLPELPEDDEPISSQEIEELKYEVLIIGGGPAGLSAAIELGKAGVKTLIVDDKYKLGGKLVLQTHKFFGSVEDSYAGTRGYKIGEKLARQVEKYESIDIWLNTPAIGIYEDKKVGVLKNNSQYVLIEPEILLNSTGAREKSLVFPGNTLPGVYGAGAFQTLVNRDLVKAADKLFIVGGGNVGLIAGYHALQADINVVGLIEAMDEVGGYFVHRDKLKRMGVPIYTRHTIVSANGEDKVESVTVAEIDKDFNIIEDTEKTYECDTILIAVGLDSVNEFHNQALNFNMKSYVAGDAEEIAEASAAMFSGKIRGIEIANELGAIDKKIPVEWQEKMEMLKSPGGEEVEMENPRKREGIYPVFHCSQEIPCNPCISVCPQKGIYIDPDNMMKTPEFIENNYCIGCYRCVAVCPGLAVTLVDYREDNENPIITIAHEYGDDLKAGDTAVLTGKNGKEFGEFEVIDTVTLLHYRNTNLVQFKVPVDIAEDVAGVLVQEDREIIEPLDKYVEEIRDDEIVCRCERVTAGEIRKWIKRGINDINQIKAITRAGMGACGGKTCENIIVRLMRDEGIDQEHIVKDVQRPLFLDTRFKYFAGLKDGDEK
ncbi:MAG: FAD-dependent oxidoreductase [Candidatus Mcinerneyibacterium aminivorans]|uniref:FAD-dependent oxidoreductase n=1 Tax=Candidatus Mcinerneyibacterium aminivorans TaxID=2703815 RepID=A0A5D0MFU8_9BACT|nr:MAG: FAD-dependent oxidoreductase [Candidatus Mcinerneyibacterium aminivorans]